MKTLINKMIQIFLILGMMLASLYMTTLSAEAHQIVATREHQLRVVHAKELLGSDYRRSVVRSGERVENINDLIYVWTRERLPEHFRPEYKRVAQTIIDESYRYGFDPVFLMAVIEGESSFNPLMRGHFGEIGLMQIKPDTAEWLSHKTHLSWHGKMSLYDPATNIRFGAAYLSWLRQRFHGQAQLYVAAYNMGQRNVRDAVTRDIWPKDYPIHVMKHYLGFYSDLRAREIAADRRLASL